MLSLLLVAFTILAAAAVWAGGRAISAATLSLVSGAFVCGVALHGLGGPTEILGIVFAPDAFSLLFISVSAALVALASLVDTPAPLVLAERLAALAMVQLAVLARDATVLQLLLLGSAVLMLAIATVTDQRTAVMATLRHIGFSLVALPLLLFGTLLTLSSGGFVGDRGIGLGLGFIVVAAALLIAAFPFHEWLSPYADLVSPVPQALNLALVGGAAAVIVARLGTTHEGFLAEGGTRTTLLVGGVLAALLASALANGRLASRKRLAYLAISSATLSLACLTSGSDIGLLGFVAGAMSLAPALLLGVLCTRAVMRFDLENEEPPLTDPTVEADEPDEVVEADSTPKVGAGASRAGAIIAAMSLGGLPLLVGFVPRWSLLVVAAETSTVVLLMAVLAAALSALAAGRLAYSVIVVGRDIVGPPAPAITVGALALGLLVLGVYPTPVVALLQDALVSLGVPGT
jgi:NADH:ubiquinone oxidoreductase subunit 2 (subunit N)